MTENDVVRSGRQTMDGERLLHVFSGIVEVIGQALPPNTEVVLHDLSLLPDSIVTVYGDVTGRGPGEPATDLLLEQAVAGFPNDHLSYETVLPDGRQLRSVTAIIRDISGIGVAALCINTDVTAWRAVEAIVSAIVAPPGGRPPARPLAAVPPPGAPAPTPEIFPRDMDQLAQHMLRTAVDSVGVPPSLMKKEHKVEVVRNLKGRGMFLLKGSVEMVAEALEVTRFTIYNYLNALEDE